MRPFIAFTLLAIGLMHEGSAPAAEVEAVDEAECVEVEVNGIRSRSYNCLSQKLRPSAKPRSENDKEALLGSEAITQRSPNQLGLFNRSATETRMGNTFGTSVYPQRPATRP